MASRTTHPHHHQRASALRPPQHTLPPTRARPTAHPCTGRSENPSHIRPHIGASPQQSTDAADRATTGTGKQLSRCPVPSPSGVWGEMWAHVR
ncbi:hypothetical protein C8Q76DRAFT_200723 [Earliella scabrosa]|nr:hypothetical protein C8Q76DRAFT_200723 [Earliella scabrosa]